MNAKLRVALAAAVALVVSLLVLHPTAETTIAKPEDVGLSTERLARINEVVKRHIAAGEISGAVTLVARHGRIAHLEAAGVMDADSKKPMTKDAVFRIASMTKPVTGVAIMMMMEEGKLRITDPVSKFIPQFKEMKVAVALPGRVRRLRGRRAAGPAALLHRAGRTRDHDSRSPHAHLGSGERPDEQPPMRGNRRLSENRPRRWPTTFPGWARPRSNSSRVRAGCTARKPASTHWDASSRSRRVSRSISFCGSASSIRSA